MRLKFGMSVSKVAASPANHPDEHRLLLRTEVVRPACAEDARLVDWARRFAPLRQSPQAVSECDQRPAGQAQPLATPLRVDCPGKPSGFAHSLEPLKISRSGANAPAVSTLLFSAVLLFSAALFAGVFGTKGDSTRARSDVTRPASVKIISLEERPTDLDVDASSDATRTSEPSPGGGAAQPVEPSLARAAPAPAAAAPSVVSARKAASIDAAQGTAEDAPMDEDKVVVSVQPRAPHIDRTAKFYRRSAVDIMVARNAVTAPGDRGEMRRLSANRDASAIPQGLAQPHTIAAPASAQEPVSPMTHVFGPRTSVLGASTVDQSPSKSGDWAIQFAAPKSEAEAKVAAARLNAKYALALNGATIRVQKTQVNGETLYTLRAAGLSKDDATALCVRVKGRNCSLIK